MTSPQAGMPMSGSMPGGMMEMSGPMMAGGRGMGMSAEQVEERIAVLRARLKITNVQDELWNSFADTMRTNSAAMTTMRDGMMTRGMPTTLPDRLAAQQKMIAARAAMPDRMETSTKPLYAALSADQRKVIDQMTTGPMGMM
jgi:LTXXQ motif family protein